MDRVTDSFQTFASERYHAPRLSSAHVGERCCDRLRVEHEGAYAYNPRMAKIVSFNTDAPGLKPKAKPHDGYFDLHAQLQHFSSGKDKDVQSIRLRASGGLLLYERRFPGRDAFTAWLRLVFGVSESSKITEQVMGGSAVPIALCYDNADELIEDGFKPVIVEIEPKESTEPW
jgi:hypothetical protein